jgi:hypothetical protein
MSTITNIVAKVAVIGNLILYTLPTNIIVEIYVYIQTPHPK